MKPEKGIDAHAEKPWSIGYDNAHSVQTKSRKEYSGRITAYDHHHSSSEKITSYFFTSPEQLLKDFFNDVDEYLKK